ncbi:MAG: hypothetical protein H0X52_01430 [Gemmatimonadetes bacterium]|nr:hypothetical protein [Gemmatimonadota bacterium]
MNGSERPDAIGAVVSRGGRPALARMRGEVRLEIVPGATHLFEEAGTLEQVAGLARDWFGRHLGRPLAGAGEAPA